MVARIICTMHYVCELNCITWGAVVAVSLARALETLEICPCEKRDGSLPIWKELHHAKRQT